MTTATQNRYKKYKKIMPEWQKLAKFKIMMLYSYDVYLIHSGLIQNDFGFEALEMAHTPA